MAIVLCNSSRVKGVCLFLLLTALKRVLFVHYAATEGLLFLQFPVVGT